MTYFDHVLLSGLAYFRIWLILEFGLFSSSAYFRGWLIFGFGLFSDSRFSLFPNLAYLLCVYFWIAMHVGTFSLVWITLVASLSFFVR